MKITSSIFIAFIFRWLSFISAFNVKTWRKAFYFMEKKINQTLNFLQSYTKPFDRRPRHTMLLIWASERLCVHWSFWEFVDDYLERPRWRCLSGFFFSAEWSSVNEGAIKFLMTSCFRNAFTGFTKYDSRNTSGHDWGVWKLTKKSLFLALMIEKNVKTS